MKSIYFQTEKPISLSAYQFSFVEKIIILFLEDSMNNIELKTVNELSKYLFFVPAYQRGYRWTNLEVLDLLNDIDEFEPREIKGSDEKTWYCLQPIVIKKRAENEFEVIDGQQRLTTTYLILYYLNQDFVESRRDKLFSIDYETRKQSKEYLLNPEEENDDNIDFYYIHKAYNTIDEWFRKKEESANFDKNNYRSKFKFYTKVIWYETSEDDPIKVFTRLNIGKISLTNAELIKALFLNSSNFQTDNEKRMHLRQLEIANEWDNIENALQNDKLWYFLSKQKKEDNRIELIFNLMNTSESSDPYSTFRFFNSKLSRRTEEDMDKNWEEIQAYFQRFNEWFNNRELYHKIGFILTSEIKNVSLKELYTASSKLKKKEFINYLDNLIRDFYKKVSFSQLDYEDKHTRSVLLLYNILTMLQNECDSSYFPFDEYKLKNWNIEHIASRKDSSTVPQQNREDWLNDVICYIDKSSINGEKLIERVNVCLNKKLFLNDEKFVQLYDDVTDHFNEYLSDSDINGLSNLTLLDESTNKGYKNAVFPLKRKKIIDLDKSGGFVPICTKNTFLKYFSDYPPKVSFWTDDDRAKYEEDLIRVLSNYLEVED